MQVIRSGRRAALSALAAFALAGLVPAWAQDPTVSLAKTAALEWLALVDKGDAADTYAKAAQRFRTQMTSEDWARAMTEVQGQFGEVSGRTFVGARLVEPQKDQPQGMFIVLGFRTEFAKRHSGIETVTLEREADGVWRVVGYLMQ